MGTTGSVAVWDARTGVQLAVFGHNGKFNTAAWSPDESFLLAYQDPKNSRLVAMTKAYAGLDPNFRGSSDDDPRSQSSLDAVKARVADLVVGGMNEMVAWEKAIAEGPSRFAMAKCARG
jgi:hypothetical protein